MMIPPNSQEQQMQLPGNSHLNPPMQAHIQQQQQQQPIHSQHLSQEQQIQLQIQRQSQMSPHHHQQQPMHLPHSQQQISNHPTHSNPPTQPIIPNSQPQLQHPAPGNFAPQNFSMNMPPQHNQQFNAMSNQMMPSLQQSQINPSPIHNNMIPMNMAINQPVTSTILPSNDSRTNIPVYQQQR